MAALIYIICICKSTQNDEGSSDDDDDDILSP